MRRSKALGALITALQLAGLVAFALSFHALFDVLSNTVSGEAFTLELTIDPSTGLGVLTLNVAPRNSGFLGVDLSVEMAVVADGEYVARDSTSGYIDPGGQRPLSLSLTIPAEVAQDFQQEKVFLEIALELRTLENLVGVTNTLRIEGGGFE